MFFQNVYVRLNSRRNKRIERILKMGNFFGVDYYPEHWPHERWETDVRLMKEMGLDMVRMAEFSWSKLEPVKGEFNFAWLDEIIALLAKNNIKTILGTPSAAAPPWIIVENPEIQPIDMEGRRRHIGGRHHNCQSNLVYREHIKRYVTAFIAHFGDNPNVIGWQIDNELGNSHKNVCTCPSCEAHFREWLKEKYGDINTLNQKWGTVFWSQDYIDFAHIQAPKLTMAGYNPSHILDWKRFCSDLVIDFHKFQSKIIRAASDKFLTHNYMRFPPNKVDYFELAEDIDFVSHDHYPCAHHREQNALVADNLAATLDLARGYKQKSFWLMEHQSNITGWEIMGRNPRPGEISLWATQCIAHGADAIVFFRWRTCTVGTEQYWHGVLPHSGIPGRHYNELKELIQKVKPLMEEIKDSVPTAKVGMVFSYDQWHAFEIQPHNPDLDYIKHFMGYYTPLFDRNVAIDIISDKMDFSKYDLLIAPLQYLMPSELESKYKAYVENGGNLVLDMRAGIKDETNIIRAEAPIPGKVLGEVLGLQIPEYDCLRETTGKILWDGSIYDCEMWADIIELKGACALAVYDSQFYAGTPAITANKYGKGTAYYVGTEPSAELAAKFVDALITSHKLYSFGNSPKGVEIVHRAVNGKDYIFVLNHTNEVKQVKIPAEWTPYYENQTGQLKPFTVEVYFSKSVS